MPGPGEPRGRQPRAREPDPVVDPLKPNATIELETADLLQLGQRGLVQDPARLRDHPEGAVEANVFVDLGPEPAAVAASPAPTVIVEPELAAPAAASRPIPLPKLGLVVQPGTPLDVQCVTPAVPRVQPVPRSSQPAQRSGGGLGLVVLVYLLATAALAISIYYRFVV
ncbi:MAG: hypothetical protein M3680_14940 [Myxococcota bacterium]|nr:hypothetical protein [Myxococcota bacterium]